MDSDGSQDNFIGIWCVIRALICSISVNFPLPHVCMKSLSKEYGLNAFAKSMMMKNFMLTQPNPTLFCKFDGELKAGETLRAHCKVSTNYIDTNIITL